MVDCGGPILAIHNLIPFLTWGNHIPFLPLPFLDFIPFPLYQPNAPLLAFKLQKEASFGALLRNLARHLYVAVAHTYLIILLGTARGEASHSHSHSGGNKDMEIVSVNPQTTNMLAESLSSALNDFDPNQYDTRSSLGLAANRLLSRVLSALVFSEGISQEQEILTVIRDAVFSFIRTLEPTHVMDTLLVSRVRMSFIRSLSFRFPELRSIKVPPVECFLQKRGSLRSSSEAVVDSFRVDLSLGTKSIVSAVLKLGNTSEVMASKVKKLAFEAKTFGVGNKNLAALFVHTPAQEMQDQVLLWLGKNFHIHDNEVLELFTSTIMDGWLSGLGVPLPPSTDALGQLLLDYTSRVYSSRLEYLKDIESLLQLEAVDDPKKLAKLCSDLEALDRKIKKISKQMTEDLSLLGEENGGGSPVAKPSPVAEKARLSSLINLFAILKKVKEIASQSLGKGNGEISTESKRIELLTHLDEVAEKMPPMLDVDHSCARRQIGAVRSLVELLGDEGDEDDGVPDESHWTTLDFNNRSNNPITFIIKLMINSNSELMVKVLSKDDPDGERVMLFPTPRDNMSTGEMEKLLSELPAELTSYANGDDVRIRYNQIYRTLALEVPVVLESKDSLPAPRLQGCPSTHLDRC